MNPLTKGTSFGQACRYPYRAGHSGVRTNRFVCVILHDVNNTHNVTCLSLANKGRPILLFAFECKERLASTRNNDSRIVMSEEVL